MIIDWTDGCVAHPFFDLATFVDAAQPDGAEAVRAAYLDSWQKALPNADVERAARLATPLAFVHHAISYQRIGDNIESGSVAEIGSGPEEWLRRLAPAADTVQFPASARD